FFIDCVDAHEMQPAVFEHVPEHAGHPVVFPLVEPTARRGKCDHACPAVTEFEQFHVAVKRRTPPAVILPAHEWQLATLREATYTKYANRRAERQRGCLRKTDGIA